MEFLLVYHLLDHTSARPCPCHSLVTAASAYNLPLGADPVPSLFSLMVLRWMCAQPRTFARGRLAIAETAVIIAAHRQTQATRISQGFDENLYISLAPHAPSQSGFCSDRLLSGDATAPPLLPPTVVISPTPDEAGEPGETAEPRCFEAVTASIAAARLAFAGEM